MDRRSHWRGRRSPSSHRRCAGLFGVAAARSPDEGDGATKRERASPPSQMSLERSVAHPFLQSTDPLCFPPPSLHTRIQIPTHQTAKTMAEESGEAKVAAHGILMIVAFLFMTQAAETIAIYASNKAGLCLCVCLYVLGFVVWAEWVCVWFRARKEERRRGQAKQHGGGGMLTDGPTLTNRTSNQSHNRRTCARTTLRSSSTAPSCSTRTACSTPWPSCWG